MTMNLADRLDALRKRHQEPWEVIKEPHSYPDGTTHFTHVQYRAHFPDGGDINVRVASHVTPDLGELLCLLHNNLDAIISALRAEAAKSR
jgi:hypothetical protein